ncbi:tbc1 domain family member 13-like [Anaeramoeba ignava]|uniref:Tbc1 domain family member 13-like n=1 Tax=Anaeramoeba ignava TaxID=1746090 RepID=A0A9Q0RGM3_ANAIG|nr:tbc1 domain family member 13-like [Anaeramoeba ignava]
MSDVYKYAEEDAFYCFTNLMGEINNYFCQSLDSTSLGINATVSKIDFLIKKADFQLWNHLQKMQVYPYFYIFRWVSLLLSQEFTMPDLVRVWDSLFSDTNRFEFLTFFCAAMPICIRDSLLESNYSSSISILQNYPPISVDLLFQEALRIHNQFGKI